MSDEIRVVPTSSASRQAESNESLGPLFSRLAQDSSALIKQEISLAKAEIRQSIGQTVNGAAKIGVAVALLAVGGLVLIAFLVLLLGTLIGIYWLAALIVGGLFTIVGGVLALAGIRRLKEVQVTPEATIETLKDDAEWARAEVQDLKRDLTS